ncbi:hypothetical protein [Cellulomonas sp. Leaf395]|uniref:hypothetical protein n=1 Tax=Cellulomonas sp. Leaf395 TaxID=1736362 RepID=UPI0006F39BD0|nr:hypothetical protein [Cellulomonas sp. Leaf395]KQS99737.1 hypothetical protein ASG23_10370 [Cellulomonas sp. Leaf395]
MRRTTTTATAAALLLPLLVGTAASPALAADSGDVAVTNTETVQARLSATGAFQGARVYEQLALTGHGTATIENPVSTEGLRNLDGFGGYRVVDGLLVSTLAVDGERRERTLSTYDKDLPLTVEVTYTFDGEPVQPGAVVGKTGTLGVHYKVTNVTGRTQDVTYDDGSGTMATASAETVIPMIGQLVTVLPSTFTDVQSDEAGIAGDGRGGTRMQFQMTLFPPIGSATAEFGYTATVSRAVIPKATLTSMPVSPLEYPSFKGGAASYQAGAQKGVDLTGAGLLLDDSVLRLHDGSAQLLAGLLQLRDGAATLSTGLNESAAPGADELADGLTGEAAPGAARLAAGARQLDAGLAEARAKAPQLLDGLVQVDSGLALVDGGLARLYGEIGTIGADPKVVRLQEGITTLRTAAATLTAGVDQIRLGIAGASGSATKIQNGSVTLGTQLAGGLGVLQKELRPVPMGDAYLQQYDALLAQLSGAMPMLTNTDSPETIAGGAKALSTGLAGAAGLLGKVECGLDSASLATCDTSALGMVQGLAMVDAGVAELLTGVTTKVRAAVGDDDDTKADGTLRGGIHSLQAGTDQLSAGGDTLASGLARLGDGASQLNDGAGDLSAGIAAAAAGSRQLSDGLSTAAGGSTQLSDGLTSAAEGAPQIVDGTQRLSDEGTSQVVVSGRSTAEDFGVKYAVLSAGAERAQTEGMAYGAPDGAAGSTAYSIEIAGVDGTGASSVGRLILAIVLFAGGIGLATFAGRRFV